MNKDLMPDITIARRKSCMRCLQPESWCYCDQLTSFSCGIHFVILQHPVERRKRLASGRMAHLMLQNSHFFMGVDFHRHTQINAMIQDPKYQPMVLQLHPEAMNVSKLSSSEEFEAICPKGKIPLVFVIDGKWSTVPRTLRLSTNLHPLPKICFTPEHPSLFIVRKQPHKDCYSTLEAIHSVIDHMAPLCTKTNQDRPHDQMLRVFHQFVQQQRSHTLKLKNSAEGLTFRRIDKKYPSKKTKMNQ